MHLYAMTQRGIDKKENEDRVLVGKTILCGTKVEIIDLEMPIAIAIADGVGGTLGGANASEFIMEKLFMMSEKEKINPEMFRLGLLDINKDLISYSKQILGMEKMATTLSGVYLSKGSSILYHIGNTRVYISQGKYLKQITEDHTTVNWLLKTGRISYEEAETYEKKNEIFGCMGGGNEQLISEMVVIDETLILNNVQKMVLTCDGIHDYIKLDDLEYIINSEKSYAKICEEIIKMAIMNGSKDDLSIVIFSR